MVNIVKVLRSLTSGNRPVLQAYGAPYVNFADKQFGVVDNSQVAQDLVGVPFFSASATYAVGQPITYQGKLYVAIAAITPGAFNSANWSEVVNKAGGTMTGPLALTHTAGSVTFAGAGGVLSQNNAKLFWNNTTYALGIGTNTGLPDDGRTYQTPSCLEIKPQQTSTDRGISIWQRGATVNIGTRNQFDYNTIRVENNNVTTQPFENCRALSILMIGGGLSTSGSKMALDCEVQHLVSEAPGTNKGDLIGGRLAATGSGNFGGTDTGAGALGTLFGAAFGARADTGATNLIEVAGAEFDVGINPGASARFRFGVSAVHFAWQQGVDLDAAFEVGSALPGDLSWRYGLLFTSIHGQQPVWTNGTLIGTDGAATTVINGIDFSSYTFTGNFLNGAAFSVNGAGKVTVNNSAASTSPTTGAVTVAGGAGVVGDIYTAANLHVGNLITSVAAAGSYSFKHVPPSGPGWGLAILAGGELSIDELGVASRLKIAPSTGVATLVSTIASTSPTTGAFTVAGGIGGNGALFVGGGVVSGAPTGGNKGAGTVNGTAVYDDNVLLTCIGVEYFRDGKVSLTQWDALAPNGRHEVAHKFAEMLKTFDPRDPEQYISKMVLDGALPGMPSVADWQHNALSVGEMYNRLWLAVELLASAFAGSHGKRRKA